MNALSFLFLGSVVLFVLFCAYVYGVLFPKKYEDKYTDEEWATEEARQKAISRENDQLRGAYIEAFDLAKGVGATEKEAKSAGSKAIDQLRDKRC